MVLEEFTGITNNIAYQKAFNSRVLLRNEAGQYIGNDQRELFLPFLRDTITKIDKEGLVVLDVGGGGGELLDHVGDLFEDAIFSVEEPNRLLLEEYAARLSKRKNLRLAELHNKPIQDYYEQGFPNKKPDLIIGVHMIYHLTDPFKQDIEPGYDLEKFLRFSYSLLNDDGIIFLVYADLMHGYAGKICQSYYNSEAPSHGANISLIYQERNKLLSNEGAILECLEDLKTHNTAPKVITQISLPSSFYGKSVPDLAAMSLSGELCSADDESFNTLKLMHALQYLENHLEENGIHKVADIQSKHCGMYRAPQPQVLCVIQKCKT